VVITGPFTVEDILNSFRDNVKRKIKVSCIFSGKKKRFSFFSIKITFELWAFGKKGENSKRVSRFSQEVKISYWLTDNWRFSKHHLCVGTLRFQTNFGNFDNLLGSLVVLAKTCSFESRFFFCGKQFCNFLQQFWKFSVPF